MNLKELIMLSDIYAPQAYADFAEMPWGIMFYDSNNPTMHDVNHACIINDGDFDSALADIRSFYIQKKLVPRIYLAGAQHRDFKDVLEKQGFAISRFGDFQHFLLTEKCSVRQSNNLFIRELRSKNDITQKLLDNLYSVYMQDDPDTVNRSRRLLRRVVESNKCRLFCGFYDNEPACIAMLVETRFGMYCLDLVETAQKFKGRGFARELISYFVKLCDRPTFLYSENPTAIRIYEEAGFRRIKVSPEPCFYRAVYTKSEQ